MRSCALRTIIFTKKPNSAIFNAIEIVQFSGIFASENYPVMSNNYSPFATARTRPWRLSASEYLSDKLTTSPFVFYGTVTFRSLTH